MDKKEETLAEQARATGFTPRAYIVLELFSATQLGIDDEPFSDLTIENIIYLRAQHIWGSRLRDGGRN